MKNIGQGRPFTWEFVFEALSQVVSGQEVEAAIDRVHGGREHRNRKVPLISVVWLIVGMGLFGDRSVSAIWRQVAGTLKTLWAAAANLKPPTKSALCKAQQRLGARVMRSLFRVTATPVARPDDPRSAQLSPEGFPEVGGAFYRGLRLLGIDGQKLTMPDTPANARAFGRCSTKRGKTKVEAAYPQLLLMRLMELGTHVTLEALIKPVLHAEAKVAAYLLNKVSAASLLLWDNAFCGYKLLKSATERGIELLGRVPSTPILQPVKHLSDDSRLSWFYPNQKARLGEDHSQAILVRIICYTLDDPNRPGDCEIHRLMTTLLDEKKYPARELIMLYHQRWEMEIDNDELTTHQLARAVDLRSQTPAGVVQELYGVLLAHNAIRRVMHESAQSQGIDPRTLSFVHAVRVIQDTIPLMRAARTELLPGIYKAMLELIGQGRLPVRDNRINPRVIKVTTSKWPKKKPQHLKPPQPKKTFAAVVVMLK